MDANAEYQAAAVGYQREKLKSITTPLKGLGWMLIGIGTLMFSMSLAMRGPAQEYLRNSTRISAVVTGLRSEHQTGFKNGKSPNLDYFLRVRYQAGGATRENEIKSSGDPSLHKGSKVLLRLKNNAPDDVQLESIVRHRIWNPTVFAVTCALFLAGATILLWARRLLRSLEAKLKDQQLAA